jgi:formate dehydrogenase subunit gamma
MSVKQLFVAAVLSLVCMLGLVPVAAAQQKGGPVNPTARSVQEKQLLEALKPETGGTAAIRGRITIPDKRAGNLIQPQGRDWRAQHQETVPMVGMIAVLGMLALVILFYFVRGRVRVEGGFSGQTVTRFAFVDRFAHWLTAVSFIALGLTGLNMTFGKRIVLPIIGPEAFTSLSQLGKFVHNYVSFAFLLGVLLMLVLWVKDNFPHPRDIVWLVKGGGIIGNWHAPAGRFNLGQKLIFWVVVLGGLALAVTGYVLMFPFTFADVGGLQLSAVLHGLIGLVMIGVIIAHIYIGTLGMEGAFSAMGSGKVDVNWAKSHHSVWAEKVLAEGAPRGKGEKAPAPAE